MRRVDAAVARPARAKPGLRGLMALILLAALMFATAAGLTGCTSRKGITSDNQPTLKVLASRSIDLPADPGVPTDEGKAIAAYREFQAAAPRAPQRAQALRRLGDLEMDRLDRRQEEGTAQPAEYRAAVERYESVLKAYPNDPGNDRVLYQLARAHEQAGSLESALKTLDQLVAKHPQTLHKDEAQFRRGELLFTTKAYPVAEAAFAAVLRSPERTPYHERALYMQGWSQFKQARLEEALGSFMGVLDAQLANRGDASLEELPGLTRAERELIEDTFRVSSLSLQQLQGAASIAPLMTTPERRSYEFRVYQQLGELYLTQERVKDAAETFGAFARLHPRHAQAPRLQARVIDIYAGQGFAQLALEAKRDYVQRYGANSEFRRDNPQAWAREAQPLLQQHLIELARHHHALFQKQAQVADMQEAERWYRQWLGVFPQHAQAPQNTFLLAELMAEARRPADAVPLYEKAAYDFAPHARSADAGYAALLGYAAQVKALQGDQRKPLQKASADSARRFAGAFPKDPRTGAVLADAADTLSALGEGEAAAQVAQQVLGLQPAAPEPAQRLALTVLAHRAFEQKDFARAEQSYVRLAAMPTADAQQRADLEERLAASIHQQGEQARKDGKLAEAAQHFERVGTVAPRSSHRAAAQVDQAAVQIAMKNWEGAARTLESFRQQHPNHALAADVAPKLAAVYLELNRPAQAAAEFERLASSSPQPEVARSALWQAAELHQKAGASSAAAKAYEQYVRRYPAPLESATAARWQLTQMAQADGQSAKALAWARELKQTEEQGAEQRTPRTRAWSARASLALAAPALQEYRQVALVEPLARQLKLKKTRMENVLQAYASASESGIAEVVTEATFKTAALYQDFGRALLAAPRPKGLKKAEAEQYVVMLEEQAFPFEEKAAELHELNARRTTQGLWDDNIRDSLHALAQLRPARWGRTEKAERPVTPSDISALERAVAANASDAESLNLLGVALRRAGRFNEAQRAYERAAMARPGYAAPVLNEAILNDLYLRKPAQALAAYERYQALQSPPDPQVGKWMVELKSRKPEIAMAAAGGKP